MQNERVTSKFTTGKAFLYGISVCGLQFFAGYVNSFQTQFYSDMYSALDAHIFYAVAVIILVAKLLSCIADPIIGSMIDRSNFKKGKMRPWIAISTPAIAFLTMALFIYIPFGNLPGVWSKLVMYAYITVTTVAWNISFSLADIPSQGLLSLLSQDANERNKTAGIANVLKSIAGSVTGVIVTFVMLILTKMTGKDSTDFGFVKTYYLVTAVFIFVIAGGLFILNYFFTQERVRSYTSKTVSFKEMFVELKRNKMMRLVFISILIGFSRGCVGAVVVQAGGVLIGAVKIPLLSDLLAGGEALDPTSNATWLTGLTSAITSMISLVIVPFVNKKFGEKKTFILFALYGFIIALAAMIFYLCVPEGSPMRGGLGALILVWVVEFFVGFMYGTHGYSPVVMTADIIDYQEWKTGERREGVDYAILSMANKIAGAFAVGFGILMVAISGYNSNAVITTKMQNVMFLAYVMMPGLGCLLAMIPILGYKIDEKTKITMRAELAERRAKAEAVQE